MLCDKCYLAMFVNAFCNTSGQRVLEYPSRDAKFYYFNKVVQAYWSLPYLLVMGYKNLTWFTRLFLTRRGTWARYTARSVMGRPFTHLFHKLT